MSENSKVYALLIAIDKYRYPVGALRGCVSDSIRWEEYLTATVSEDKLFSKTLRDAEATRENIALAFLNHLTQASADDTIFIHYSGHGSQEPAPKQLLHYQSSDKCTNIVAVDSYQKADGKVYPAVLDKELRYLMNEIAKTEAHIVMVMDCCHSGAGTRSTGEEVVQSRFTSGSLNSRAAEDYIFLKDLVDGKLVPNNVKVSEFNAAEDYTIPAGRHVLLAGCRSDQTSKETMIEGKRQGVFTWASLEILKRSKGNINYRDLVKRASALVMNKVNDQVPQVESSKDEDAFMGFLKGAASSEAKGYYTVTYNRKREGWNLDVGAMQGLPQNAAPGSIELALWDFDAVGDVNEADMADAIKATVSKVQPAYSELSVEGAESLRTDQMFKARILSSPSAKKKIWVSAEETGNSAQEEAAKMVLQAMGDTDSAKMLMEAAPDAADADYHVTAYVHEGVEKFRITRSTDQLPLVKQSEGFAQGMANWVVKQLERIVRHGQVAEMENATTNIPAGAVTLVLEDLEGNEIDISSGEITLQHRWENGGLVGPGYRIKIKNNWDKKVWASLLYLEDNYAISTDFIEGVWIEPGFSYKPDNDEWVDEMGTLEPYIDDDWIDLGITEVRDTLKVIAGTSEFDSKYLHQDGLPKAENMRSVDMGEEDDKDVPRGGRRRGGSTKVEPDWTTDGVSVRLVRPLIEGGENNLGNVGVTITSRGGLNGTLTLGSITQANRGNKGGNITPPDFYAQGELVDFVFRNGESPALNLLEIIGGDAGSNLADNPLVIEIPHAAPDGKRIVPIGFENGEAIEIGSSESKGATTTVTITQLLAASPTATPGLGDTVKVAFQVRG